MKNYSGSQLEQTVVGSGETTARSSWKRQGNLFESAHFGQGPRQKFIPNHLKGLPGKRSTELGGKPSYAKVVKFASVNEAIRASRLNTGEKMMDKQSNSNLLELSSSHQRGDKVRESSTLGKDDKVSENQTGSDLGGEHCLGSNDNPFMDKLLVNGSTGKPPATFEINQAMRDVGKREVCVVSHDPESVGFFTSKDKTVAHQNIVVSGDNNVDDLLPNLTTSSSLDKSLNDGGGNLACPTKLKEYLESCQEIGQIFAKNDGVVLESNVGVSSLGIPNDAILAQQVKELVSNSLQHVDVDVDNNATLGNNIQLGDIPVIVPNENLKWAS
ncbi:hypothetical protein SUGI_0456360 [Cryptomeria japonica]|nr:hypothetical protein SUGI_0456360 [Cryptomeria japonica]